MSSATEQTSHGPENTAGYTPGPWRLRDDAQGPCMVFHPTDQVAIASLTDAFTPTNGFHDSDMRERNANARLIAAAPDLLEALKLVFATGANTPISDEAWSATVNAILKAEGR